MHHRVSNMKFIGCQSLFGLLLLFAACGDTVENVYQGGMGVVASDEDLPECTGENDGDMLFVKGDGVTRICVDGDWTPLLPEDTAGAEPRCKMEALADSSGLKVVCDGDSVGVVLNGAMGAPGTDGADGKDGLNGQNGRNGIDGDNGTNGTDGQNGHDGAPGQNGTGCSITGKTNSTVTVTCGDSVMVIDVADTSSISLEELMGYTQKGPFLKGSTVYLYELNGALYQTNGNFTSIITSDDGRYRFRTRGLKYPYAMVVVDGYYRNEVTGKTSDAPIRLRAITDVSGRVTGSVNVNLLTHLEYERVVKLATGPGKLKLKEAKQKAQKEILAQFHIDTTGMGNVQSEDMDVFGSRKADAALLAVSVLLQGNGTASDLSVILTQIVDDMTDDGKWDSPEAAAARARVADVALFVDQRQVRMNVEGWGLNSEPIGDFESILENYIAVELFGGDACGNGDDGAERVVSNSLSAHNGEVFHCVEGKYGHLSGNKYFNENVEYGHLLDMRDRQAYRTVKIGDQVWMAENLNYEHRAYPNASYGYSHYKDNECGWDSCKVYGRYYVWSEAMDSIGVFSDDAVACGYGTGCAVTSARGNCPTGWHLPDTSEWRELVTTVGGESSSLKAVGFGEGATNETGFTALPAGYWSETAWGTDFYSENEATCFWTINSELSSSISRFSAFCWTMGVESDTSPFDYGMSYATTIRCIQDKPQE